MKRGIRGRVLLLLLMVVFSIYFFIPSTPIYGKLPEGVKGFFPARGLILGLDLRGGIHLVLEVEKDRAVELLTERRVGGISNLLEKAGIKFDSVLMEGKELIRVKFPQSADKKNIEDAIINSYQNLILVSGDDSSLDFSLREGEKIRIRSSATDIALEVIRNRIDPDGVKEPVIQKQGESQILVQIPGEENTKGAVKLIEQIALLEFRLVDNNHPLVKELPSRFSGSADGSVEKRILRELNEKVPEDSEILFETLSVTDGEPIKSALLVKKRAVMTGDMLTDASVRFDEFNEPYVSITFDTVGANLFSDVTGKSIGKRLAIVLDGNVYSAPVIQDKISGGKAQITGRFELEDAQILATTLRAGSLPAPIRILENLSVGPSLGRDSIRKGIRSTIIAAILVLIFIMFYYRGSGVIAIVALMLNLIGLMGAFSLLHATLTLPGIAGIVLTIGIGIDSNVLIMERIREELRIGKSVRLAINAGYEKAFLTIIDSHVTTLVTAMMLFLFGTGPIRGFAVGLSMGIVINLFTALVGTKVVYDYMNNKNMIKELSI